MGWGPSTSSKLHSALQRYGLALILTCMSMLIVNALAPRFGHHTPTLTGFFPHILATWYGGLGPGLVCTALSTAGFGFIAVPRTEGVNTPVHAVLLLMGFCLDGVLVSVFTARVRARWLRARASARRNQAIYELSAALGDATTTSRVCEVVLNKGLAPFGASSAGIFMMSPSGDSLRLVAHVGVDPHVLTFVQSGDLPLDRDSPASRAARRRRVIAAADKAELRAQFPALEQVLMRWLPPGNLCAPMVVGDHVLGVLALAFDKPRAFGDEDRRWAGVLAQDSGAALDRVRLYEAEQHARSDAEQANRAKDDFVKGVSGALRAPLTSIAGRLHVLAHKPSGWKGRAEAIHAMSSAAQIESDLIDRLIDLAHIVASELHLERTRLDLTRVVRASTDELRAEAESRGVALSIGSSVKATVVGDGARLREIVLQLLRNAIQFSPKGGRARVDMELRGDRALVHVTDDGVGISPAELPHVFEPFRHLRGSPRDPHLGIGLTIAKYVAGAHGGTLLVDSPGKDRGTFTTLELPLSGSR
jgi:signal transduction histidine kinase